MVLHCARFAGESSAKTHLDNHALMNGFYNDEVVDEVKEEKNHVEENVSIKKINIEKDVRYYRNKLTRLLEQWNTNLLKHGMGTSEILVKNIAYYIDGPVRWLKDKEIKKDMIDFHRLHTNFYQTKSVFVK